jgi:hypothetical protein
MVSWGYVVPAALLVRLGVVYGGSASEEDERTIQGMVDQAVARLNKGDVSALDDFWDENADYVGVDGTLIKGAGSDAEILSQDGRIQQGTPGRLH